MLEAKKLAPVVLFTYNRPDHTKRTIEALAANELADQTELFVFSDAPKAKKDESEAAEKAWNENKKRSKRSAPMSERRRDFPRSIWWSVRKITDWQKMSSRV